MIFVTVGSRKYAFDRLFRQLDALYEAGILTDALFAQTGTAAYKPRHYAYAPFLSEESFARRINDADIVVSHGASGSIMKALTAGKKVIAVTRLAKYKEHINDHQIQNNEAFASNHYVLPVYEMDELGPAFQRIAAGEDGLIPWNNPDATAVLRMVDQFIETQWTQSEAAAHRRGLGRLLDSFIADSTRILGQDKAFFAHAAPYVSQRKK